MKSVKASNNVFISNNVIIREAKSIKDLKKFISVQWYVYRNDPYWVPPLISEQLKSFKPENNALLSKGPHIFYIAEKNNKPVGRILVGIDNAVIEEKGTKEGWFSLFESADEDKDIARLLLDTAAEWLINNGMESMYGPVSPTNGDDSKGLLIEGFNMSPVLMNSYNPEWYPEFFEEYGLHKAKDLYAYFGDRSLYNPEKYDRIIEYAMRKFKYKVERFEFSNIARLVDDMHEILVKSTPDSWENFTVPTKEDIIKEINMFKSFADLDLLYMARSTVDDKAIGFMVALPDYNEVFKKLNGRLFPIGFIKFLILRRKIKGIRFFVQFVIPEYRNTGVNTAIMYRAAVKGIEKGYTHVEGSTIGEENTKAISSTVGVGLKKYKTYRYYRKTF